MCFSVIIQLQAKLEHTDALGAILATGIQPTDRNKGTGATTCSAIWTTPQSSWSSKNGRARRSGTRICRRPGITEALAKAGPLMAGPFRRNGLAR